VLPGDGHLVVLLKTWTADGWRADGLTRAVAEAALQAAISRTASRQRTFRDDQLRTAYAELAGLIADPLVTLVAKHGIDELRVADDDGVLSLLGPEALPCNDSEYFDDLCGVSYFPVPPEDPPWGRSRAPVGGAPRILLVAYLDEDLTAAADEVRFLRSLPNVDVTYLPAEACTKKDIPRQLAVDHSHVHFACHGVLDIGVAQAGIPEFHDANFDPARSALLLRRDTVDQRFRVEARDLDGLSMAGRPVVTLSSCSTAGVRSGLVAGVAGLPERFLRGGATAVVGARWEVSDRYACEFTKLVYTSIADGVAARSAFFRARRELRHRTKPAHWAAWCYLEGFGGADE
jgi:CHAT domain